MTNQLKKIRIKAGSFSEAFEKAQDLLDKDISELNCQMISADGEGKDKYLLEFSLKDDEAGKKGSLFEDVFMDDFDVIITEDKMKAYLLIPQKPKSNIDKNYLYKLLKKNNVVKGIMDERIDLLLYLINKKLDIDPIFLVASGNPPVEGKDAEVLIKNPNDKYDFEVETPISKTDKVDYKKFKTNNITIVKEDTQIAYYNPPLKSENGYTVTGDILEAEEGKDIELHLDKNLRMENNKIISLIDGMLDYRKVSSHLYLSVSEVYKVTGNVDYKTGDITFPGTVIITGEIMPGFEVNAGKNVVAKIISGGSVKAGGNIVIKEGIIGRSFAKRAICIAEKDVEAKYAQYAEISASENVNIKNMIRDSNISAGGKIEALGYPGSIFGGTFYATKGVEAKILGSPSFTKTKIIVGSSAHHISEFMSLIDQINEKTHSLKKITYFLGNIENKIEKIENEEKKEKIKKLIQQKRLLRKDIFQMKLKIQEIKKQLEKFSDSKIIFHKEAMPGVKAIINDSYYTLETLSKKSYFMYDKEKKEVRLIPLF